MISESLLGEFLSIAVVGAMVDLGSIFWVSDKFSNYDQSLSDILVFFLVAVLTLCVVVAIRDIWMYKRRNVVKPVEEEDIEPEVIYYNNYKSMSLLLISVSFQMCLNINCTSHNYCGLDHSIKEKLQLLCVPVKFFTQNR